MKLKTVTGATPEERLSELGLILPPVPEAVADHVTHAVLAWLDRCRRSRG